MQVYPFGLHLENTYKQIRLPEVRHCRLNDWIAVDDIPLDNSIAERRLTNLQ